MKNLRTHGKKKIQWAFIIAAFAVIVLFTACKQFLADPEEFLSYWASESFVKDHSIGSEHRPDDTGVQCVGSLNDADITLSMHNPKNFSLVMPTASAPAGIVEFKELSEQPQAGTHYELEQVDSGTLKLTYKKGFLEKYEQGSRSLNPTITLKAKDGRVFQKTYTFGIKSNTPPPKPAVVLAKQTNAYPAPSYYVLCIDTKDLVDSSAIVGGKYIHDDIAYVTVNKESYEIIMNKNHDGFEKKPTEEPFLADGTGLMPAYGTQLPTARHWVLYYKTNIEIGAGNKATSYTITLSDNKGVVSDEAVKTIGANDPTHTVTFSVADGQGTLKGEYNSHNQIAQTGGGTVMLTNVPSGTKVTFTATPSDSNQYKVGDWTCTPSSSSFTGTSGNSNASLTVTADTNVTVRFVQLDALTLTKLEIHGKDAKNGYVTLPYKAAKVNQSDITLAFSGHSSGIPFTVAPPTLNLMPGETKPITINVAASPGNYSAWSKTVNITREQNNVASLKSFKLNGETKNAPFNSEYTVASDTAEVKDFAFDAASTGATASVSPQGNVNIPAGTGRSFTITVKAQDGTVKQTITFTVKRKEYAVNYSVDGGHGKIKADSGSEVVNGSKQVEYGENISFTATPDNGWEVDSWTGATANTPNTTATLSNVTAPTTVTVKFKPGEFNLAGGSGAWEKLKKEAAKPDGAHTIVITGEITATTDQDNNGKISIRRELIIKSSGSSASLNANNLSGIFNVDKKLTLENITLKNGKEPGDRTGAGAYVNNSTLIMKGSSTITNCSAHKGGGVYVNNGTLIMQDSSAISSCTAVDKGSGVYVSGTFKMSGSAKVDTNSDVYLASGKSIDVTGTLTKTPAARITPDSYTDGRVLATGAAEKANFKVTPDSDGDKWRYKKVGNEIKFVPATLTVTFTEIKCVVEHDDGPNGEYYWTMKVDGSIVHKRHKNNLWVAGDNTTLPINKSFTRSFSYFPASIPVDIEIWEHDDSFDDHVGTTKAHLTYNYDDDQWKWAYDGGNWNTNPKRNEMSNPNVIIGDGGEEIFTEQYRTSDGDTDVTIKISWKE